jgi:hypothetical protein
LILELGMGSQPFQVDFNQCGQWATSSWVKSVWEKCFIFGITLEEGKLNILPPRERDEWLMPLLCKMNFTPDKLLRLNGFDHIRRYFFSLMLWMRGGRQLTRNMSAGGQSWSIGQHFGSRDNNRQIRISKCGSKQFTNCDTSVHCLLWAGS